MGTPLYANRYEVSFQGDGNILELDNDDGFRALLY